MWILILSLLQLSLSHSSLENDSSSPNVTDSFQYWKESNVDVPICSRRTYSFFCEEVDNYPEEEIQMAVTNDSLEHFGLRTAASRSDAGHLFDNSICDQRVVFFNPKAAVNQDGKLTFLVNTKEYKQIIQSEICEQEKMKCRYLDGALPYGLSSMCRQKYAYLKLLAYEPNHKKTVVDSFKFPSSCVCYVKDSRKYA